MNETRLVTALHLFLYSTLFSLALLSSCEKDKTLPISPSTMKDLAPQWEYRVFSVTAPTHEKTGENALASNEVLLDEKKLNQFGAEGWYVATSWLEMETAYPNLGKPNYVTGIHPNVRPMRVVLLLARRK